MMMIKCDRLRLGWMILLLLQGASSVAFITQLHSIHVTPSFSHMNDGGAWHHHQSPFLSLTHLMARKVMMMVDELKSC